MKRWGFPLTILVVLLGAVGGLQRWQAGSRAGFTAPDFTLPDLQGHLHRLSDLRGKVVFLNLWTTWCPPCREEMPALEALYRRLKQRDFVVLAVSQDEGGAAVVGPFVRERGLTFPVLLDPLARTSARYGVTGYPETFVIDRDGNVIQHMIGPAEWASDRMIAYVQQLLDRPAGSDTIGAAAASN